MLHEGRRFSVNFTKSDGQMLALFNRGNWQIRAETNDGIKELRARGFNDCRPEEREQAEEDGRMIDKLIDFCICDWDNEVMPEMREHLEEQKKALQG